MEAETDLRRRFTELVRRAEHLGLSSTQLLNLDAVQDLEDFVRPKKFSPSFLKRFAYCALVFACVLVFIGLTEWPVSRKDLIAMTLRYNVEEFESELCLLDVDSTLVNLARPPVDCRICRELTTVDRVKQLSTETFETKYAYSGRPVVVTDAMANWTAVNTFSFGFFRGIYSEDSPVLALHEDGGGCQFFPYRTNFKNLSEVFQMSEARASMRDGSEPWYIGWSNCDSAAANILRTHYQRPYFLPRVAESSRTDWIFMGSPGYGADLHIDNVYNPSWQAQVTGTKHWTLEPPPECYLECKTSVEVTVHAGEIIVLDTNQWFHSTEITGSEMSITIGSEYD